MRLSEGSLSILLSGTDDIIWLPP